MAALSARDIGPEAFALLFERHPQPLWVYALDDLRVLAVNDAALALYGYTRDEFLRLSVREILAPEALPLLESDPPTRSPEALAPAQRHRHRHRDGRLLTVEASAHGLPFHGRPARLVMVTDLSDLAETRAALRERERMLSTLIANLPGMAYRCRNAADWAMELVSEGCLALTGYTPGELTGGSSVSYGELIHPEDRERVWDEVQAALAAHRPFQIVYRLRDREGTEKWVWEQGRGVRDGSGALLALEGFISDITAQRRAEEALRESEARFRRLFENAVEGVFRTSLEGRFLIVNPACARILGYDDPAELLVPDAPPVNRFYVEGGDRAALLATLRDHGVARNQCLRLRRRDGHIIWVNENVHAWYDDRGELAGMEGMIEDITARIETERALRASEERFARAARGANDGLWDWNLDTGAMYYSPRWQAQLGYVDRPLRPDIDEWLERVHPHDRTAVENAISAHLAGSTEDFQIEYRIRHADGGYRWMLARGVESHSQVDRARHLAGSQTDITARKRAELRLQRDALHDALTALPNRVLLLDRLNLALRRLRREPERRLALLYLDLDRFKPVNDTLGHAAGDALLVEVARRWRSLLREHDTLARLGGDEFVLLLDGLGQPEDAVVSAERLLAAASAPMTVAGTVVSVSASAGITLASDDSRTAEALLRDADCALYRAKDAGGNRAVIFEAGMRESVLRNFQLEKDLRMALGSGQLILHYQPIIRLSDRHACGFEVLVRWQHPRLGEIAPMEFLPMAIECGLSLELDLEVARRACGQLAAWRRDGRIDPDAFVAVNLSAPQLGHADLPEHVAHILAETSLPAANLRLEITERAVIDNPDTAESVIEHLRALGVGVVLDDFGAGYSSLNHLYRLRFEGIKVDRGFILQMESRGQAGGLMELLRLLGEKLCINVVPEGVEDEEQLERLRRLGFQQAQGYLFGRPLPPEEALAAARATADGKPDH